MIIFVILPLLVARLRGMSLKGLWREKSMYPLWGTLLVFFVFQAFALAGDYRFIPYAQPLQTAAILSLLWPILRFRLYGRAALGAGMVALGSLLNRLVTNANGGRMPVYPTLSRLTGYFKEGALAASGDARHALMSSSTRLGFLADYIDTGLSIMSPGDVLIHGFTALIVYGVAAALCSREAKRPC